MAGDRPIVHEAARDSVTTDKGVFYVPRGREGIRC